MKFKNKYFLINATEHETVSENTVLFSYENLLLQYNDVLNRHILNYIGLCKISKGRYNQLPHTTGTHDDYMSHDQLTTFMNMFYGMKLNNEYKEIWEEIKKQKFRYDNINPNKPSWKRILHPRDIIYYAYLNKSILGYLGFPFLFFSAIYSCFKKYKTKPTLLNKIKHFIKTREWLDYSFQELSTSGKMLWWTRFKTCEKKNRKLMKITEIICNYIIKKKFIRGWKEIFQIYFPIENHPNYILAEKKL